MRKWLVFVLLLGGVLFPSQAGAQGGIVLETVNINLWSEYDQPTMLVIHEFELAENTSRPAKITVRFPRDGNLTAVAYRQGLDSYEAEYDGPESQGNWQIVTLNVEYDAPYFIEYYQPLDLDGKQRSFTFQWIGDYPVNQFNVISQIPADSTNIIADPPFTTTVKSEDGKHLIGEVSYSGLDMGEPEQFNLIYERDSVSVTNPSNSAEIQEAEQVGPTTEGRVSIDSLPWAIGGFGLVLIGLAFFFYWRSTQGSEQKSRRRHRSEGGAEAAGEQAYCQECGTRAHPGDRFCRTCGSKLRS